MYNSFTLSSTLFSTEGKNFFKGICAPHSYGHVQYNHKKSCVLLQSVAKIKAFFIYWAGAENKHEYSYLEERFLK